MQNSLSIIKSNTYTDGYMTYAINIGDRESSQILIPQEIISYKKPPTYIGYISYKIIEQKKRTLELTNVWPLGTIYQFKKPGLGSFIISQTLLELYKDSVDSKEINPKTHLFVNSPSSELVSILENRTFQKDQLGYKTTIQNAAEKSKQILSKRNWL